MPHLLRLSHDKLRGYGPELHSFPSYFLIFQLGEPEWNGSQEQWQTMGNDGFVVRLFRWNEEPEPGPEEGRTEAKSFSSNLAQVFNFQGICFMYWLLQFVMAPRVMIALENSGSHNLSWFKVRQQQSISLLRLTSLGKQRNRTVGNWRTSRSSGWRVEKSALTRCLAARFRIRVWNFNDLNLLKSFWKSLHESSFMVI